MKFVQIGSIADALSKGEALKVDEDALIVYSARMVLTRTYKGMRGPGPRACIMNVESKEVRKCDDNDTFTGLLATPCWAPVGMVVVSGHKVGVWREQVRATLPKIGLFMDLNMRGWVVDLSDRRNMVCAPPTVDGPPPVASVHPYARWLSEGVIINYSGNYWVSGGFDLSGLASSDKLAMWRKRIMKAAGL